MSSIEQTQRTPVFTVENIGGIEHTEVEVPPGVTVLEGKNATNRTSFLQAIMAAMGSNQATLKGDADEGRVELDMGDAVYERRLKRIDGAVQFSGDGYLDDPEIADLFAFLLEINETRQAVARGDDLRDLIMRPVDVDQLRAEIEELEAEKGDINDELASIESLKRDLPDLEQRRTEIRNDIEAKREELEAKEAEIEDHNADIEETRAEKDRMEEKFDELRETRSELESVRYDIESEKESITSLKQERSEIEDELEDLPDAPMGEYEELDERVERLRDQKQRLENEIQDLQSVIQFNESRLEEGDGGAIEEFAGGEDDAVTDQLVGEDAVVCWTCGSEVESAQIEETLDRLRELRADKLSDTSDLEDKLDELLSERRSAKQKQRKVDEAESRLEQVEREIDRREETVEDLQERKADLTEEVEALEEAVEDLESEDFSDVLDLHKEANQLEFEIDRLESNLESVEDRIEEVEETVAQEDDLRERREELLDELEDRRTRIDQIEADAVEQFNNHMDAVLEILAYENLDRIWIERREQTVREGRERVQRTKFELHVVRSTENGTAYEDTVDHLSESEREVTGLIFGLAGYLVHDLHEEVPFMLLDSLEAIDSDRIAALVEYFSDYADYLVVALLPEDAQALDDSCNRVTEI